MSEGETIKDKEFNLKKRDMKRDNTTGRMLLAGLFILKGISFFTEKYADTVLLSGEYFIKGLIGIFFILAASNGLHNAIDKSTVKKVVDKFTGE